MEELGRVKSAVGPDETLLVVDAMTGQEAATLTDRFNKDVGITGAILTKLDGDTRGGAAISVRAVSGCDIKYVGMGEKMAPLEPFYADRLASRILGMGDVVSLVEKAQQEVSEEEALKTMQKMQDATFDFNDFIEQAKLVQNMGGAASMMSMLPGMGGGISKEQIAAAEVRMKGHEALINSMTKREKQDPRLLITDKSSRSRQVGGWVGGWVGVCVGGFGGHKGKKDGRKEGTDLLFLVSHFPPIHYNYSFLDCLCLFVCLLICS